MTAPVFGLQFILQDDQAKPAIAANLDVVGIIGPCNTADPSVFLLDTPVFFNSTDTAMMAKIGTDGYILDAINGINDQLADFEVAAQIVYVRTDYGVSEDANIQLQQTIAGIMGSSAAGTGVHAFAKAPNTLYLTPRLICAPGYTGQLANSLDTLTIGTVGHGYIPGDVYQITFAPGNSETNTANVVLPQAHAVADSNGRINEAQITIDGFGAWMTVAPTATLPVPDGSAEAAVAATGQIQFTANPGVGSALGINGTSVTFVGANPSGNEVLIGVNLDSTLNTLMTFLNGSSDVNISQASYVRSGNNVNITDKTAGAAGNSFALTSTVSGVSLSAAHLTGGSNSVSPTRGTLTATIALGANPVVAEVAGVLDGLIGHMVAESAGTSMIGDENWRTTLNNRRVIGVSGGVKILDPVTSEIVVRPVAPRVIGAIIARDFETGAPFHSAANRPIQGIIGPARNIGFNLTDGATEGQELLAVNMGVVVRGLAGVENAISSGGFVFIGTDNLGDDPLWQFYNVMRGRDYIHLSLMPALRTYLGRSNIDRQTVQNVLTTVKDFLQILKNQQHIIDFRVNFQGALNTADEIRLGHLTIGFQAEEPPVLRRITTMSARYRPAIDLMVQQLQQQLSLTA